MKIMVIGCGSVGAYAISNLLDKGHKVLAVDAKPEALIGLERKTQNRVKKLLCVPEGKPEVADFLRNYSAGCDVIALAVPGDFGYNYLKLLIEHTAVKRIVDVSFSPENSFALNELAKERGKTVLVDCGLAPGLNDMLLGDAFHFFGDKMHTTSSESGALEVAGGKKFRFAPADDLELYTRDVNFRQNGIKRTLPGLLRSNPVDLSEFSARLPQVLTDQPVAFLTDCIRTSETEFPNVLNMTEKTIRYGSTFRQLDFLKRQGFFYKGFGHKEFSLRPHETARDFTDRVMSASEASDYEYNGPSGASPHLLGPDGYAQEMTNEEYAYTSVLGPLGFVDADIPLGLNGSFYPFDVTLKLLEKVWTPGPSDRDCTVMRVYATGEYLGNEQQIVYSMCVPYDHNYDMSSLAKGTGAPFATGVELLLSGLCTETGILGPGYVGKNVDYMQFIQNSLQKQRFSYIKRVIKL